MQNKMVSIILPVFNAERFLSQCLDSILRQTYQDWELIAVDDGSKDRSLEILKSYEKRDDRIHIISKKNEGVSIARNVALSQVRGEYIYFVDSDDIVMQDALSILIRTLESNNATFVKSDFLPINEHGKQLFINKKQGIRRRYEGKIIDSEMFYSKILMDEFFLWTCLFRRDIIEKNKIRFIPHCRLMEDAAFIVEYLLHSSRNVYKNACVYGYRKYEGTASEVNKDYSGDLEMIQQSLSTAKERKTLNILLYKRINKIQQGYSNSSLKIRQA
jgi:glycosyltransferase involved in cell wall biosynthesis